MTRVSAADELIAHSLGIYLHSISIRRRGKVTSLCMQTGTAEVRVYSIGIGEARWSRRDGMQWLRERFNIDASISRRKGVGLTSAWQCHRCAGM